MPVYMSFELIYNFVAARIVAYGPGLVPFMHDQLDLKGYITGAELVNSLIGQCSWFIHVMPVDRHAARPMPGASPNWPQAIENVQQPQEFYSLTGRSDFRYGSQNPVFGLTVQQARTDASGRGRHAVPAAPPICASGAANGRSSRANPAAARPR